MALIWTADLTLADTNVVAMGFNTDGSQRQNGAGAFNDNTVPWPMVPVTSPASRPGKSLQFTIPDNYRRYEVVPSVASGHPELAAGTSYYFGNAFYMAAGFPLDTTHFQLVEQIHQAWGSFSPPVAFEAKQGGFYLTGGYGLPNGNTNPTQYQHEQRLTDLTTETWYNLVYYVGNFSTQVNTSTISIWLNGVQLLNNWTIPCPTLVQGDASSEESYRKMGIYHSVNVVTGLTIYQTDMKLATTYAEADPTPPEPPPPPTPAVGTNRIMLGSSFLQGM